MPRGGMSNESTDCSNFNSIGKSTQLSLPANSYLVVGMGQTTATIKSPVSLSAMIVALGSNSSTIATVASTDLTLDNNGVHWA